MENYLSVANSWILWGAAIPSVLMLVVVSIKFTKASIARAPEVGLSRKECFTAFRVGCFASIGPALGAFISLVSFMAVIGAPIAWMRLTIPGTPSTELIGAQTGAAVAGTTLGAADYDLTAFSASVWVMCLNTLGWVITVFLFAHRFETIKVKLDKIDSRLMAVIGVGALLGVSVYFAVNYGLASSKAGGAAFLVGLGVATVIELITRTRWKRLSEFSMGISMFVGMLVGQLFA